MKKFILFILFLSIFAFVNVSVNSQALTKRIIKFGVLTKLNSTEEQFAETWRKTYAPNNEAIDVIVKFYDNLTSMQMALNAGEINHMVLPDSTAEYLMSQTKEYEPILTLHSKGMGLAFGFMPEKKELRDEFNKALDYLKSAWILSGIEAIYITSAGTTTEPAPVKFEKFDDADTIKVAVTGDLPFIDYIAADGTPAGFNTAVLAEIGRFLHKNIEMVNIESGARTAALVSGRVDVVFWYEIEKNSEIQHDSPEGVILSQPYYEWNKFIHLKKASKTSNSSSVSRGWNMNHSFFDFFFGDS